jgi:hypothetical protein
MWLRPCPLYTPPVATTDWVIKQELLKPGIKGFGLDTSADTVQA